MNCALKSFEPYSTQPDASGCEAPGIGFRDKAKPSGELAGLSSRDDFTEKTKEKLAHRAGYRCSNPDCGIQTRGAASNDHSTINVGFAAHITAASVGGPRYDPKLSRDERRHHKNGIWLCGTHGKLVDSDASHFTVNELLKWKRLAEERSFQEVIASNPSPHGPLLAGDKDVQTVFELLLDYSKSDLSAFQRSPGWPLHPITLNLSMLDIKRTKIFAVSDLASRIELYDEVAVIAAPGTGKTTTLLQLAEATLANAASMSVFIPLSEWATGSDTFFQSLLRRAAFRHVSERQFELLARHGKLVLLLDGWNELDEASRRRVRNDLKSLRRDFPDIRIVISSRHKDLDFPVDGPVVEVELLTEDQQLKLAKSLRGRDGESLMDHAWRTPGLRELVAIPLYLTALLEQASGRSLPTTKEGVLRSFVAALEKDRDKQATLREFLQGFHREFLVELAVEATEHETVALSEGQARAVVNTVQERLRTEKQIAELLQPMKVLDVLVNAHMLVRSGAEAGGVSFQHQQFQEWFASFHVQQLMLSASMGDHDANKMLRENILDVPVWEEAILFACDRLSGADEDGREAVAHAILDTLGIDPLLSAEMIWRSSHDVWDQIRHDVVSFVRKWHTPGRVDRAVKFMIDTGRAEFSEFIWPLVSDEDDQVHSSALGAGRSFRPGVLGPDAEERIAALPDQVRERVISLMADFGDMDGIDLATSLAKADANPNVRESTIESLVFRRLDRFAKEILETSPDEVWRSLARTWHSREFADPEVSARIREEADKLCINDTDPRRDLDRILGTNVYDPNVAPKVRELVKSSEFSDKPQGNREVIYRAYKIYPKEVVAGLLALLEQGKQVPFGTDELLCMSDVVIDDGPLVDWVLKHAGDEKAATIAASVVGPKTVGNLVDQIFALDARIRANNGRYDKTLSEDFLGLRDLVGCTKADPFIQAVLARAHTENPHEIRMLADLVSRHGGRVGRERPKLPPETQKRITDAVQRWAKTLLASPEATRAQFAEIARAAERLGSPELVPELLKLLSEDLTRRKRAEEEWLEARKQRRRIENDAYICWTLQYRRAFAAIGDQQTANAMKIYLRDPEFGFEAAHVLKSVWLETQPPQDESGFSRSWPDFSVVPEAYRKRQSGTAEETHPFVDDIIAAIEDLTKPGACENNLIHALMLASVAFSMPYADKRETINALLQLPVPSDRKQNLLMVLALSGEAICSEIVLRGIDDLLEEANSKPWLIQDQNGWRLKDWLRLLPFTERPAAVLEVLDRAERFQADPWNLRSLLSALTYAPSTEAESVLGELARRDERFLEEYSWRSAFTSRNTLSGARLFLDLICNASFTERRKRANHSDLGKKLSELMAFHHQFRQDVYKRLSSLNHGVARSVLEDAIAEAADTEGVLLLTREAAARGQSFQLTNLPTALRNVLVGLTPMESSRMQHIQSIPAPELRKHLFHMVVTGSEAESRLASECLRTIDKIRDDYGYADSEPRHPYIATGVPWPLLEKLERADE